MLRCVLILYICVVMLYAQEQNNNIPADQIISDSLQQEAVQILQDYLRIDTTNPPGNELATAEFLQHILRKEGIATRLIPIEENRANLVAVLPGDGSGGKAVILLHHMDVVPADAQYWKVPPFSGDILNGEIYGRGTVDIKGKGIIDLMTMIHLKREKFPLKRDLIFLAVADEENNSIGSQWMVDHEAEFLKQAEFLLDEGACPIENSKGQTEAYFVATGEKALLWLTLTFYGTPGHGSLPQANSSVNQAIMAAYRLANYQTPLYVSPQSKLAVIYQLQKMGVDTKWYNDLETSLLNPQFIAMLNNIPSVNSLLRDTISITCLQGSDKINTIPNEAKISLDCRLLPNTNHQTFLADLRRVIQNEQAKIQVEVQVTATQSPWDTAMIQAIRTCATKRDPQAPVIPTLLLSTTDSSFYRPLGIHCYGFESYFLTEEEYDMSHGNNERLRVENVGRGIGFLSAILKELNR